MSNDTASQQLFSKIYNQPQALEAVQNYIKQHERRILRYLSLCKAGRWELFFKKKPIEKLALVYLYLPICKANYEHRQIPDSIFFDTMDDIRIWIEDHRARTGEWGLFELNWIQLHMQLQIFKLGRLQFQRTTYYCSPLYQKGKVSIPFGSKILNVHIPRGGALPPKACDASFSLAETFFKEYYPDYPTNRFMCHSWLLYPENAKFMKPDSNILQFAKRFDCVASMENPAQAYLWLFGQKVNGLALLRARKRHSTYGDTSLLPQTTSLQMNAVRHIEQGGKFGDTMGVYLR